MAGIPWASLISFEAAAVLIVASPAPLRRSDAAGLDMTGDVETAVRADDIQTGRTS